MFRNNYKFITKLKIYISPSTITPQSRSYVFFIFGNTSRGGEKFATVSES